MQEAVLETCLLTELRSQA